MEQDAERLLLLQKISESLLGAGYFRARISSISPFDLLTGGLAWCITASNADVDFDIFFDDDATLGEKIKVGEAIEGALQKMSCPYPLQAHQIQGLDYQAVYPVAQWLVKHVLTTREKRGDQLRRYAHLRFHGNFELPEETAVQRMRQHRNRVKHKSSITRWPERRFYRNTNIAAPVERIDRLQCTLLEYGHFFVRPTTPFKTEELSLPFVDLSEKISPAAAKHASLENASYFSALRATLLALPHSADGPLTSSRFMHVTEEINAFAADNSHSIDTQTTHWKQVVAILKQLEGEERRQDYLQSQNKDATSKIMRMKDSIKQQDDQRRGLLLEMDRLHESAAEAGIGGILQKMLPLVEQQKIFEEEELSLRTSCKQKHAEQLANLAKLESQVEHLQDGDAYQAEVDDVLSHDLSKLKLLKVDMSRANQKVLLLRRKLDDLPSQTELLQYERCFVELYLHIQGKLRETRKYYSMYNALAEGNELTVKETSLLNSINTQFGTVMTSPEGRIKFVDSMSDIAQGVQQKLEKMKARLLAEQNIVSSLREQHGKMVVAQRHYANLMKLFQEECAKNEKLRSTSVQITTGG